MKAVVGIAGALLLGSCAVPAKPSVAIHVAPASIRDVSPDRVTAAKRTLTRELSKRGFVIASNPSAADYVVYTYYTFDPTELNGRLVEVSSERNSPKVGPITPGDSLPVFPRVTDDIAGATP